MDENDNAPKFTKKNYEIEIPENMLNGTTFHTVSATDDDFSSRGHLTFSLDENSRKTFSIQSIYVTDTGVLQIYNMTVSKSPSDTFRKFHYNHLSMLVTNFLISNFSVWILRIENSVALSSISKSQMANLQTQHE
jgi:hypothetical protein